MTPPVVVQLIFGSDNFGIPDWPDFITEPTAMTFVGLPLWKPHGRAIYMWSIDYVTCRDERWVAVGPFATVEDAERAVRALRLRGYRIVNEHCFEDLIGLPSRAWTDG